MITSDRADGATEAIRVDWGAEVVVARLAGLELGGVADFSQALTIPASLLFFVLQEHH